MGDRSTSPGSKPVTRKGQGSEKRHGPPAQPPLQAEAPSRPLAINYKEAARLIGRSPRTIQRMIEREELTKLKDVALVEYASLVAWVEEQCRV